MALAIVFDSVGFGEWFVLLAVVLVVVGPKNLPSTARKVGNVYAKFRRAAESFKRQLLEMDTEFNRVVDDAAREVESAAAAPDETPKAEAAEAPASPTASYDAPEYENENVDYAD